MTTLMDTSLLVEIADSLDFEETWRTHSAAGVGHDCAPGNDLSVGVDLRFDEVDLLLRITENLLEMISAV